MVEEWLEGFCWVEIVEVLICGFQFELAIIQMQLDLNY